MLYHALSALALAQLPLPDTLVLDTDPSPVEILYGSKPRVEREISMGPGKGGLLFAADVPGLGPEWWVGDGTSAGTRLLADVDALSGGLYYPVSGTAFLPSGDLISTQLGNVVRHDWETAEWDRLGLSYDPVPDAPDGYVEWEGEVWFYAERGDDVELWRTDGSEAGTLPVPGGGASELGTGGNLPRRMVPTSFGLVFTLPGTQAGGIYILREPDGVPELVLREGVLPQFSFARPIEANGRLYFRYGETLGLPSALWSTDGTPSGTRAVSTGAGGQLFEPWILAGNGLGLDLAASADSGFPLEWGTELWRVNADGLGRLLVDLAPGPDSGVLSVPGVRMGDRTVFVGRRSELDAPGLWVTDGTVAGTVEFQPDVEPELLQDGGLVEYGGRVGYVQRAEDASSLELWSVGPGEAPVPIAAFSLDAFWGLVRCEAGIAFGAEVEGFGWEVAVTDLLPGGTELYADVVPGPVSSDPDLSLGFRAGDRLLFRRFDGMIATDLTLAKTELLVESWLGEPDPSGPFLTNVIGELPGGTLLKGSKDAGCTFLPYGSTALEAVTAEWGKDITGPRTTSSRLGSRLVLTSADGGAPYTERLWITDGTTEGTLLLEDTGPLNTALTTLRATTVDGLLLYSLPNQKGLWVSDGEPGSRSLVEGFEELRLQSFAEGPGGWLYITLGQKAKPIPGELWRCRGNPLVFEPISLERNWIGLRRFGDRMLTRYQGEDDILREGLIDPETGAFAAFGVDPETGVELFEAVLAQISGERILLQASFSPYGTDRLLVGDGTVGEFTVVESVFGEVQVSGSGSSLPADSMPDAGVFVRGVGLPEQGSEPHVLLAERTQLELVSDVRPGKAGSSYFWSTDGPYAGQLEPYRGLLPFTANDGWVGSECHGVPVQAFGAWYAEPFAAGCGGSGTWGQGGWPDLDAEGSARLGDTLEVQLENVLPEASVLLFGGAGAASEALGGACWNWVASPVLRGVGSAGALGRVTWPLEVPTEPELVGLLTRWQAAVLDPSEGALDGVFALSNGLEVVVGP